jgi:hypothetical protein
MGLPQELAARILTIGRSPYSSDAYGNPACGSAAPIDHRYGAPNQSYGYSPYHSQASNVEYQPFAAHQAPDYQQLPTPHHSDFPQLPVPQGPQYRQPPTSQGFDQYGQYAGTEQTYSAAPHIMSDGTTYFSEPNEPPQAAVQQEGGMPIEPIYETGYPYNYDYENYTPLNSIQEGTETEHHYPHEPYGPENYAGETYVAEPYAGEPYAGEPYAGEPYVPGTYHPENYPHEPGHGHGYH